VRFDNLIKRVDDSAVKQQARAKIVDKSSGVDFDLSLFDNKLNLQVVNKFCLDLLHPKFKKN
jgi:hypothetical protein